MKNLIIIFALSWMSIVSMNAQINSNNTCLNNPFVLEKPNNLVGTYVLPPLAPPPPPPPPPPANVDRKIIWIHGMGGNSGSMQHAMTYRADYWEGQNVEVDYSEATCLHNATTLTRPDIESRVLANTDYSQNFIISHSYGGIVSRDLDKWYEDHNSIYTQNDGKPFSGIISIGGPHLGAKLADLNVNHPEQIEDFLIDGCVVFGKAFAIEIENDLGFWANLGLGIFSIQLPDFVNPSTCGFIATAGKGLLEGRFQTGLCQAIVPNSQELQDLAQNPRFYDNDGILRTDRNVAAYGIEEDHDDLFFRFAWSAFNVPNDYDQFQAGESDVEALDFAENALDEFVASEQYWDNWYNELNRYHWPWNGSCQFIQGQYICPKWAKKRRDAFRDGIHWFSRVNDNWKHLIGAIENTYAQTGDCQCSITFEDPFSGDRYEDMFIASGYPTCDDVAQDYPNRDIECSPLWERTITHYPSDGLVTAESAQSLPNAGWREKMEGSNHFQMVNDMETKRIMDEAFKGDYGLFFDLDER
jgi:hypothetical protein